MNFASDNASGAAPAILAAVVAANQGHQPSYGAEAEMERVTSYIRDIFEAPRADVRLVLTGTAANALSLGLLCPPWGAVFCHPEAHVNMDECGAPEFFTDGAKLITVPGPHGRIDPDLLQAAIDRTGDSVHSIQRGCLTLTNVTEAGTVLSPAQTRALCEPAKARGMGVHLDGARFANAVVATGASPADLTWRAGVDVLSFGGTKNGCLGVEAVVLFDPETSPGRVWELELRRKRAAQLMSKHRFLSAQFAAYLHGGLWLDLAGHANRMAEMLAQGLAAHGIGCAHPVEANILFPQWPAGLATRLRAAGAVFYDWPGGDGREGARLVTSWATTEADVDQFLTLVAAG